MKKNEQVSTPVIKRLPRYHRYLEELKKQGVVRISSKELSQKMGLTASQIRQDLTVSADLVSKAMATILNSYITKSVIFLV